MITGREHPNVRKAAKIAIAAVTKEREVTMTITRESLGAERRTTIMIEWKRRKARGVKTTDTKDILDDRMGRTKREVREIRMVTRIKMQRQDGAMTSIQVDRA